MVAVVDRNEVLLYGTRFPIIGPVTQTLMDPFPPRVVQGDPGRADEVSESTWGQSDWSGGLGVERGTSQTANRFYWGALDTRFPRHLALPPLVTLRSSAVTKAELFVEYNLNLYAVAQGHVYQWNEAGQTFGAALTTLSGPATDAAVYKGKLYVAQGSAGNVKYYNGAAWADAGVQARALCAFAGTLYALDTSPTLHASTDGTTWTTKAALDVPGSWVVALLPYFDATGNAALYAVVANGLWGYNSLSDLWVVTPMTFPYHPAVGRPCVWQGTLYIPVGGSVYAYDTQTVRSSGPDRDEGLPADFRGRIGALVPAHGGMYALLSGAPSASGTSLNVIQVGFDLNDTFWSSSSSSATLLYTSGSGWHQQWISPSAGLTMSASSISGAGGTYRLWLANDDGCSSLDLPTGLLNPLKDPTSSFARAGTLISPWFTADWPNLRKLALRLEVVMQSASATETLALLVQYDTDPAWYDLGVVATSGKTVLEIAASAGGQPFHRLRLQLTLARDPGNALVTPVLESLSLGYVKRPRAVYGYQFAIDLTKTHRGQTPRQLRAALLAIIDSPVAGSFCYLPEESPDPAESLVLPARPALQGTTGLGATGRAMMSLVQLKTPAL